ncbi:hypothetical protein HII13_005071 [Brettanomyces bruxellensis]|uniref:DEBR0S8_02014g1_1 n=1 Tax=Dekkera bruxellensis TaxID=5007 RepID=A0A7D9D255_DEKBR|nr:uncharacterized protein BRETT_001467 [Brettanomyces bruxellensis]KAF6006396.1 hypothetical protein HII13_005071 [Brettanomyces bruxellensis]KAF6006692.1 hypothetical protein HII12_004884 [Brettanomyces bruxellensis]QOU18025.1 hypothetical protein BRETT_001467 [Brettanomyces bruxellensis]VUG20450.1 ECM33 [Brettanomyces bruxellensis]
MKFVRYFIAFSTLCLSTTLSQDSSDKSSEENIMPKCFKPQYEISSSGDIKKISDCQTISGSINIHGYDNELLELGSIRQIKGDLKISNASQVMRIEAPELESIDGSFTLSTLTSLTSASFPKLESVDTLEWKVLPILSSVGLNKGIKKINSIIMSDTSLTGFGGFNVDTLKTLRIDNNRFLERIESSVKEITDELIIAANARNLEVAFPELGWVKVAMIKDTKNLDLGGLQVVQSSAEFIENKFDTLSLPKLKSIGSTLSMINNKKLENADFSSLVEVGGGLMIIKNNNLKEINFFPALKSVGGAIEFEGDINDSSFKRLKIVKGSAIMKSSSSSFDCQKWIDKEVSDVVRGGKIECGSGNSEFTEVIHIDEDGERTGTSTGRNNAKTSDKGRGVHNVHDSTSVATHSFGDTRGLLSIFVACLTIMAAVEISS